VTSSIRIGNSLARLSPEGNLAIMRITND